MQDVTQARLSRAAKAPTFLAKSKSRSGGSLHTHLREIANKVAALNIILCQHIEKKWFHIIIECLMVQEEFCQQTQVLAVNGANVAIHLREAEKRSKSVSTTECYQAVTRRAS